jgi:hypothetical protein
MGWFNKKADPIAAQDRELRRKLDELNKKIRELESGRGAGTEPPRFRSTTAPQGSQPPATRGPAPPPARREPPAEPVFEPVDLRPAKPAEQPTVKALYNEHGVRKFDFVAAWRRFTAVFMKPDAPATNPKLIQYLAAGRVDGLRTLRVEKRVARRRFIALFIVLLALLIGVFYALVRGR